MLDAIIGSEGKFYVYEGKKYIRDLVKENNRKLYANLFLCSL
jgi:hypothetical protein